MARSGLLFEVGPTHCSLKEYDPSAVSGRTRTPVSNFVQLTLNGKSKGLKAVSRKDLWPRRQSNAENCQEAQEQERRRTDALRRRRTHQVL
jgi:hypothetical protein